MLIIYMVVVGVVALGIGFLMGREQYKQKVALKAEEAANIIDRARKTGENIKKEKVLEGQQELQEERDRLEEKFKEKGKELDRQEKRLRRKTDRLSKKSNHLEKIEDSLKKDQEEIAKLKERGEELIKKEKQYLE